MLVVKIIVLSVEKEFVGIRRRSTFHPLSVFNAKLIIVLFCRKSIRRRTAVDEASTVA